MNWRTKARLSRWIARLPPDTGNVLYGLMQRTFGSNRPVERHFHAAGEVLDRIRPHGVSLDGARCLEIGTGKRLLVPVALWLGGAERVVTVDAHRIREETLIRKDLAGIPHRAERIAAHPLVRRERLDSLCRLLRGFWSLSDLMEHCGIEYRAPANAADLDLADDSVDLQISYTVFEHVPPGELAGILREIARVLRPDALALNLVDYSDHFSHRDPSLHRLNFLRYSAAEWAALAGNRFHYLNRLRHDDMLALHAEAGLRVVSDSPSRASELLESLPPPAPEFRDKPAEVLGVIAAWIGAAPAG